MANNRMWIVCGFCLPTEESVFRAEKSRELDGRKLLCKYYPSSSWYLYHPEEAFNQWLQEHEHVGEADEGALGGVTHFRLEYEHLPEDAEKSRNERQDALRKRLDTLQESG
jgi:hypothetical protein